MFAFLDTFKAYLYGGLAVLILLLGGYCYYLNGKNTDLINEKATLVAQLEAKAEAAKTCSDSTQALKDAEDTKTAKAETAVSEAKKKALDNYVKSQELKTSKAEKPVVTKDNSNQYGGTDKNNQLDDYLSTQKLINDYIDSRKTEKATK